jgi:hypothetical protein
VANPIGEHGNGDDDGELAEEGEEEEETKNGKNIKIPNANKKITGSQPKYRKTSSQPRSGVGEEGTGGSSVGELVAMEPLMPRTTMEPPHARFG